MPFNDTSAGLQWYINTDYESNYNVRDVWKMNYTGAGVEVTVVDDGLDPTHFELSRNYQYAATGTKSSVLSLVPPHNKAFVPKLQENMLRTLTSLYDQECFNMNFVELLNACENIELSIEEKECKAVEKATRQQAQSKHWMSYIAGLYYQVQAQIFIADVEYCDFVVWTDKEVTIERMYPDVVFWKQTVTKASTFFSVRVLPELVGKWFTRPAFIQSNVEDDKSDGESGPWGYCQEEIEDSTIIGCDNGQCKIGWFYMECLRIEKAPSGQWFCPSCRVSR
ncbi:Inhibitor of growth protein 1 [Stylophora pistillata]|uniref:Inhibitor of growth protein 1 n=1 Tax=Stylophora pistillata TaxID=50429 RepID=A0A2B4RBH3_STYPI|nr:Inhibitor of growth protein 1 [Stylophora pistillata]